MGGRQGFGLARVEGVRPRLAIVWAKLESGTQGRGGAALRPRRTRRLAAAAAPLPAAVWCTGVPARPAAAAAGGPGELDWACAFVLRAVQRACCMVWACLHGLTVAWACDYILAMGPGCWPCAAIGGPAPAWHPLTRAGLRLDREGGSWRAAGQVGPDMSPVLGAATPAPCCPVPSLHKGQGGRPSPRRLGLRVCRSELLACLPNVWSPRLCWWCVCWVRGMGAPP